MPGAYGFHTELDGEILTIVTASESTESFKQWAERLDNNDGTFTGYRSMTFMDKLKHNKLLGEYKGTVLFVEHADESTREKFAENYDVTIGKTQHALDAHKDMLWREDPDNPFGEGAEYNNRDTRTFEEIYDLKENDPWDKRPEEVKQNEKEYQKKMEEAAKQHGMSGPFRAPEDPHEGEDRSQHSHEHEHGEGCDHSHDHGQETGEKKDKGGIAVNRVRQDQNTGDISITGVDISKGQERHSRTKDELSEEEQKNWDDDLMDKIEVLGGTRGSDGVIRGNTTSKIDTAKAKRDHTKISPKDFARALNGDGTSTIAATDSWGRKSLGTKSTINVPDDVKEKTRDQLSAVYGITEAPQAILDAENGTRLLQETMDWAQRMCDGWVHQVDTGVFVCEEPADVERVKMKLEDLEVEASGPAEETDNNSGSFDPNETDIKL